MTQIEKDGLGDWRLQAVTRLAADVPPAYAGGPSHSAGAPLYQTTRTEMPGHPNLHFVTPNATALALDAALRQAEQATLLRPNIVFVDVPTPTGRRTSVRLNDIGVLFDYFQECMGCAAVSFQAIESFANELIGRHLQGRLTLERPKGPEALTSEQIQHVVSTEEKIGTVIKFKSAPHSWGR